MHSHSYPQPFWKQVIGSVPIAGAFVNPANRGYGQIINHAALDCSSVVSQMIAMYIFPVRLSAHFPFSGKAKMLIEMVMRMSIGDAGGRMAETILSAPIKATANCADEKCFPDQSCKMLAADLLKLVPIIGPFTGASTWKEAVTQGFAHNISTFAMLTCGALGMMLSPREMKDETLDGMCINTLLMIAGMSAEMLAEAILKIGYTKTSALISNMSFWKKSTVEQELIMMEEQTSLLSSDENLECHRLQR